MRWEYNGLTVKTQTHASARSRDTMGSEASKSAMARDANRHAKHSMLKAVTMDELKGSLAKQTRLFDQSYVNRRVDASDIKDPFALAATVLAGIAYQRTADQPPVRGDVEVDRTTYEALVNYVSENPTTPAQLLAKLEEDGYNLNEEDILPILSRIDLNEALTVNQLLELVRLHHVRVFGRDPRSTDKYVVFG